MQGAGGSWNRSRRRIWSRQFGRHLRNEALSRCPLGDLIFDLFDQDRFGGNAEHARSLTWGRTKPTREFGKVVRRMEAIGRLFKVIAPHEVVELRDAVSERTTLVTERNATIHAAFRSLALQLVFGERLVDLTPVRGDARRSGVAWDPSARSSRILSDQPCEAAITASSTDSPRFNRDARCFEHLVDSREA